jgi:hypothetical protein
MLPRLVEKEKLRAVRYNNRLVYCAPKFKRSDRRLPELINHGLGVTEGLVRFWRSDMNAAIIPSRFFRGWGSVPEWGMQYENSVLLYEYSTRDNFYQTIQEKIRRYKDSLDKFQQRVGRRVVVVFNIAVHRGNILAWILKYQPEGPFMFIDEQTFNSMPIGKQLTAPIYLWGGDGQPYPLKPK